MRQKYTVNIGDRYGRLEVIALAQSKGASRYFYCKCDCGNITMPRKDHLYTGNAQSCGCLRTERIAASVKKHGMSGVNRPREYNIWAGMLRRCHTVGHKYAKNYQDRGIAVCDRWRNSFENFFADMGNSPSPKHSINRIDNDGDYCPENCEWATQKVQANNTRSNHPIEFNGQLKNMGEWEKELGLNRNTLYYRLTHGWTVEEALTIKSGRRTSPVYF